MMSAFVLKAQSGDYNRKAILKELKGYMKAANYSKADAELKAIMSKYPNAISDVELHNIWMNANYNLALAENRKIYLRTNPDTVKYMDYIYNTYACGLKCDSLDRVPGKKGRVKRKYEDNISEKLSFFEKNIENAGKFFFKKNDYKRTYRFIDMYMKAKLWRSRVYSFNSISDSIIASYFGEDDSRLAVLAVLSSSALSDYNGVVKMLPIARRDSAHCPKVLELACKAYEQLGEEAERLQLLNECFEKYPENESFFVSLMKYYDGKGDRAAKLNLVRLAVAKDDTNRNYWFVKGNEEYSCHLADSAIISYTNAIRIKVDDAESYSRIADIYLDKAHDVDKRLTQSYSRLSSRSDFSKWEEKLKEIYGNACKNYEMAMKYAPGNKNLWIEGLKECYYKLNKGADLRRLENASN
jgi:hypothetical protein